ncbi:hypothetical protein BTA51_03985 [Hahella sp. CCB-MM4]|uniref:hypothetical protein n=1 Tax=Hahella sp. (strain CCB-MM4) TaxID=1926491 RepID=UPI000B9AEC29|nr:hypothetical protein [Hahella sp. CCB-MM4]OZG74186.1 hypothetical protein BTA51_03985 [Hahella sp. CCB-MM4]
MQTRLIYWGGAREIEPNGRRKLSGERDNSAFRFGALNIKKSYEQLGDSSFIKVSKIDSAKAIVDEIDSLPDRSLESLDIVSHGSPLSLNFSKKAYRSCGFYVGFLGRLAMSQYYSDEGGDYEFSDEARSISDINFKKFTVDSRVQFHGCLTAASWFQRRSGERIFPVVIDNIVEELSEQLHSAGCVNSVVIGHTTYGNPNINGEGKTKIADQDYRHGSRVVYRNGEVILRTSQRGYLRNTIIEGL